MKELNYFYSESNEKSNEIPGSYKGISSQLSQSLKILSQ